MTANPLPPEPARPDVGERNVDRLLDLAAPPEKPDPDFARRVGAQMVAVAWVAARSRQRAPRNGWPGRQRLWGLAAAAALAGIVFGLHELLDRGPAPAGPAGATTASDVPATPSGEADGPVAVRDHLTPRPRVAPAAPQPAAVGSTLHTGTGECRRVGLADGSVLYLNQDTTVRVAAERQVTLTEGEVFVEVTPRERTAGDATFVVKTPRRDVAALGTRFAVRAGDAGTGVLVTQGKVKVSGVDEVVASGEQLAPDATAPAEAPRASAVLDWTRDLMAEADSPLVPRSQFCGGALVAIDPNGQEAQLSLRKYHVDVHVEDGFARTTIDQTYFNQDQRRLEGTFYFPLPPDASLSRLAMYVDGELMEGGMAEREQARAVYETIVRRKKDPALLEWVDGSTFKMRVFPLEGRQEKRIVLSYTQKLPSLYGRMTYRFPGGHNLQTVRDWSFHALVKDGAALKWKSDTHLLTPTLQGQDLVLDAEAHDVKVDRDVAVELTDKAAAGEVVRFATAEQEGNRYLMLRYRPTLHGKAHRQRRDWVFLFESSADRDPLLARVQVDVVRTLLENAEHDDTFCILTAGSRVRAFAAEPRPATRDNVKEAVAFLEDTHLVGALDLGGALAAAAPVVKAAKNPYLVHLGSGLAAVGERGQDALLKRLPDGTTYVGVGVGKRWSRDFMKAAAEQTGGYFTQINPDEQVAWRAFDLFATLGTPRLLDVQVVDNAEKAQFRCLAGSLAQGEEVCAVTRVAADVPVPETVTVSGTLDGKPFTKELAVKDAAAHADYLPRTWAKLEIEHLLAEDQVKNKAEVVALSKATYVMTPFTSLLVLENEQMYKDNHVDRGRKDHWAMYACPAKIPVVTEPLPGRTVTTAPKPAPGGRRPAAEVLGSVVVRVPPRVLGMMGQDSPAASPPAVTILDPYTGAFGVPDESGVLPDVYLLELMQTLKEEQRWQEGLFAAQTRQLTINNSINPAGFGGFGWPSGGGDQNRNGGLPGSAPYNPLTWVPPPPGIGTGSGGGLVGNGPGKPTTSDRPGGFPGGGYPLGPGGFTGRPSGSGGTMVPASDSGPAPVPTPAPVVAVTGITPPPGPATPPSVPGEPPAPTATLPTPASLDPASQPAGGPLPPVPPPPERGPGGGYSLPPLDTRPTVGAGIDFGWSPDGTVQRTGDPQVFSFWLGFFGDGPPQGLARHAGPQTSTWQRDGTDRFVARILAGGRPASLLYQRPAYLNDRRLYKDPLAFAPGMNTTEADVLAVLAAEASECRDPAAGAVEQDARALLDRARTSGWQTVTLAGTGKTEWTVACDASGRFTWERTLPTGLRERAACDGRTLWYLYPELGVGSRRTVSRFHRAELAAVVPWVLPPDEDLALGHDVRKVGPRTVALVPLAGKDADRVHLVFAEEGRLAERQRVTASGKVLARETFAGGEWRWLDADGRVTASRPLAAAATHARDVKPDTKGLVVLPLPYRTRDYVLARAKPKFDGKLNALAEEDALALLAADYAAESPEMARLLADRFGKDRRPGFQLLAASAILDNAALAAQPVTPATRYARWLWHGQQEGDERPGAFGKGALARLVAFHDLDVAWTNGAGGEAGPEECDRLLAFVEEGDAPALSWALVDLVLRNPNRAVQPDGGRPELVRKLLEAARPAAEALGLTDVLRYEEARALLDAGDEPAARQAFSALFNQAITQGNLPALDSSCREALRDKGRWEALVRQGAETLLAKRQDDVALGLVWQCWQLGDQPLADELAALTVERVGKRSDRLNVTLAAIEYLLQTGQHREADRLVRSLLAEPGPAGRPALWRLAVRTAGECQDNVRVEAALETALDLEYRSLPEVIDLPTVRADYVRLLELYRQRANALAYLQQQPPRDFAARVVRAADRWRSLDPGSADPCLAAGSILHAAGLDDLAWDYLTTPLTVPGGDVNEALGLARRLARDGAYDLAERAFRLAAQAEPDSTSFLQERVENLQRAGRTAEARALLRSVKPERTDKRPPSPS
jgi:hypothetical protein